MGDILLGDTPYRGQWVLFRPPGEVLFADADRDKVVEWWQADGCAQDVQIICARAVEEIQSISPGR